MAVEAGSYVDVPLGPRTHIGVVWALKARPRQHQASRWLRRFDMPPLRETHRNFIAWLSDYYVEPMGNVLRMVLRCLGTLRKQRGKLLSQHRPRDAPHHTAASARAGLWPVRALPCGIGIRQGRRRRRVRGQVHGQGGRVGSGALAALRPLPPPDLNPAASRSPNSSSCDPELSAVVTSRNTQVMLLDGVTGSGKTEVYFEAMAEASPPANRFCCSCRKLPSPPVPRPCRAALRVRARPLAFRLAAARARTRLARRCRRHGAYCRGRTLGVVPAWKKLGLIVVDEEHESAYKQDDGVTYHARDMAVLYGASESFRSFFRPPRRRLKSIVNVDRGRYGHVKLHDRHGRAEMPEIDLVDMRKTPIENGAWLSTTLLEEVSRRFGDGQPGLAVSQSPRLCAGHCLPRLRPPLGLPNCAAAMVEHRFRRQLLCHHCGHHEPAPKTCPQCGVEDKLVPVRARRRALRRRSRTTFSRGPHCHSVRRFRPRCSCAMCSGKWTRACVIW